MIDWTDAVLAIIGTNLATAVFVWALCRFTICEQCNGIIYGNGTSRKDSVTSSPAPISRLSDLPPDPIP